MLKTRVMPLFAIVCISSTALFSQSFTYVGAAKCKICHKVEKRGNQYLVWQESKHSQSFEELKTESAIEAAKKRNLNTHPTESPECLKCHGYLYDMAPELAAEGVTCEVCHGPGSAYASITVMKNQEAAVKNGLIVYETVDAIKQHCLKCHTGEHFDFEASWEKIKHPVPVQSE